VSESFFKNLVHDFGLLMGFSAGSAFDEMRVEGAALLFGKLAVNIGGEPVVDFVVNC
jgi:hypothetical protein